MTRFDAERFGVESSLPADQTLHEHHCNRLSDAIAYLESTGAVIERITARRHLLRGWEFYSPTAMQMLSRADVLVWAANERELRS